MFFASFDNMSYDMLYVVVPSWLRDRRGRFTQSTVVSVAPSFTCTSLWCLLVETVLPPALRPSSVFLSANLPTGQTT